VLLGGGRDDLVWLDRQSAPADARYLHVRRANSDQPGAKPQGPPGTFGPEPISPIEIGDGWTAKGAGTEPLGVGGYDVGDVTGDGIPDVANVGTFGTLANSSMVRTPALFVKPGRGDGTFAELRVFRLPMSSLSVKGDIAAGFALLPTRKVGRADPVFIENALDAEVDVPVAKGAGAPAPARRGSLERRWSWRPARTRWRSLR
jgi:hypothetical protein